jgi:L,D-peptidoglycan transpeptidase YkuD (ErfK/YbiS/YcfS/YnhG family)
MQPGFGDSRADVFDYLIAVDYNRVPGHSPLDSARPLGAGRGGGIWIHVDHGGPTHGCVSIPLADVRYLLRHLSAAAHPVVVMGDAARLAR